MRFSVLYWMGFCLWSGVAGHYSRRSLEGSNICEVQEIVPETETVATAKKVQVAYKTWCMSIPPTCTAYKTETRIEYTNKTRNVTKMIKKCCGGYVQQNGTCTPLCSKACVNGQCVAPNSCQCRDGFSGDTCNQTCPNGQWGAQCQNTCQCRHNATCDPANGQCNCPDGWQGLHCDQPCPFGRYGKMCAQACRCQNAGVCHKETGACLCRNRFCGALCERPCPVEERRDTTCDRCQNGGFCRPGTEKCSCSAGWTGEVCARPCDDGFYGADCGFSCWPCYNGGKCDAVSGKCRCPAGYTGVQCEKQCEPGHYGPDCQKKCQCANAVSCDPFNGTCRCNYGYSGERCDQRACPEGLFGKFCNNTCACSNHTICHPFDGTCMCRPDAVQLGGPTCSVCCILQGDKPDCHEKCANRDKWVCAEELGERCICLPGYAGSECVAAFSASEAEVASSLAAPQSQSANRSSTMDTQTILLIGLVAGGVVLLIIVVALIIRCRRAPKSQRETLSVGFTSSAGGGNGVIHHFDDAHPVENPAYFSDPSHINNQPLPRIPLNGTVVDLPEKRQEDPTYHAYESVHYAGEPLHGPINRPAGFVPVAAFENRLYSARHGVAPPSYATAIAQSAEEEALLEFD
ncbi:protein draper-like [Paramacrobiotus metropolitanus]|uniref:protein draper-like n=1 Tax=Paramacrobiotus metropolitanus TaxID=2943436 RepID=UPI00244595F9|nr:protein draper-like [Paramacrobiotus metropolitanus]